MKWKSHSSVKFLASLKLAVLSLLCLAAVLAYATILESMYGMRAVHAMVYGTWWFAGVLVFLGLNVLFAAAIRFPWKKHQAGFVVTHAGILVVLFGAWLTQRYGVDGSLPVYEGQADNEVILNDAILQVATEEGKIRAAIPIPETGRESKGDLLSIDAAGGKLKLVEFLPRVVPVKTLKASPLKAIGSPVAHIELFNSRFRVDQWLVDNDPAKAATANLGPATLSFQKLWTASQERDFFKTVAYHKPETADKRGYISVAYQGAQHWVPVGSALKKWVAVDGTGLSVHVTEYLPFAIVKDNRLVNKSAEPGNPAVQLLLKSPQGQEKHTLFQLFPDFATLHRKESTAKTPIGAELRMVATEERGAGGMDDKRGLLKLAQSSDDRRLLYLVQNTKGEVTTKGEVKPGEEIKTGWMDLHFRVADWAAAGTLQETPRYIDSIEGQGESNFLSAIRLKTSDEDFWMFEGSSRGVTVDGKSMVLIYGRERKHLPFSIKLEKFTMGTDPGTTKAATYESDVTVQDAELSEEKKAHISMNEPLKHNRYTFYQASYQMEEGRPPLSVFAVNYDPGRFAKYFGCLLIVLGSMLMFYMNPHYWEKLFSLGRKAA